MAVGALWAGIAGVLRATRGVSEVISTIMLNAIATGLVAYLLRKVAVREEGSNAIGTKKIPESSRIPNISIGDGPGQEIYGFVVIAVVVGFALLVRAQQDPVRLRPARHRPVDDRGRRQRHQRQAG